MATPHPPHKLIIERINKDSWRVVARATTRSGLSRNAVMLDEAPDLDGARQRYRQIVEFRKRELVS